VLPFDDDAFFAVFRAYNTAIWPTQILAYVLGAIAVGLTLRPNPTSDRIISGIIAAQWAWTGIAYHWALFSSINPIAHLFAILFVIQAGLLAYEGMVRKRLAFGWRGGIAAPAGLFFIAYAATLYPLFGGWTGHVYPDAPTFGLTPCPLTIFTFGLLLLTSSRTPKLLLTIPLLWSAVGGSAAFLLGFKPDWMLPISGVTTAALLSARERASSTTERPKT
jgi:hypothetical protein